MLAADDMDPAENLVQCNVRMPQAALDAFDAWADELNAAAGYRRHTRSDLMRDTLLAALRERDAAKAAAKGESKKARKR